MGVVGNTTISRERFLPFYEEARPLIEQHWREIAHYPDIPLDVNVESFVKMDELDWLRTFVARVDGVIVGYAIFILRPALHYQRCLQAICDVIYVDPNSRALGLGMRLLRETDRALKAEGVRVVWHHQKLAHPALGLCLKRRGYEHIENNWAKRLDREG